jgi:Sap, sulfolipid-1-addressing protein
VNGPAFVVGWVVGLMVAGTAILLVAGGADATDGGEPASWVGWLKLGLGLALLAMAAKQWRSRPAEGETAELPAWMKTIDLFFALGERSARMLADLRDWMGAHNPAI